MSDASIGKNGSDPPAPLDAGLKAAFGIGSVLESLAPRLGERGKVFLREEETGQGSPVIDPRAAEAAGLTQGRGNYQLLGEIARGGMGTVFKGHDQDLGRDVALKVLHEKLSEDPAILQRFVEEAQIGGQLQHPGIVPVYELGLMADDRPFFTMKLVKGRTLAALLKARNTPDQDRHRLLSIFEQICQTLAYAHSKGVIHRDLKPANVMVGAFGEVQVVDWGLAKVLGTGRHDDSELAEDASQISVIETVRSTDTDGSASMAGSVLGTPAYMPPEQAQGNVEELDERADVFALGAVLMTILTGQPPYVGPRKVVLTMAARANQVEALERLAACDADPELVDLCIECLSPDMQARPANAGELSQRITAHLASLAERARRAEVAAAEEQVRATEALARVAHERHARRLTMGLAAALAVAMLGIGGWMLGEGRRADREREVAARAQVAMDEARVAEGARLWPDAIAAAGRARVLVQTGEGGGELLGQVDALLAELEASAKKDEQQARLDSDNSALIRELGLADRVEGSMTGNDWAAMAEAMHEVFRSHGLTPFEGSLEEAAARLTARGISEDLAAELNLWGNIGVWGGGEGDFERLHHLARLIDPDPVRDRIRDAFLARDIDQLRALALAPGAAQYPAVTLRMLAFALNAFAEHETVVALLRRTITLHSGELMLHMYLGDSLEDLGGRANLSEALRHQYAAQILRPEVAKSPYYLGLTLFKTGEVRAGIAKMREAVELSPNYTRALNSLSWRLSTARDPDLRNPEEALRCARQLVEVLDTPNHSNTLGVALYRAGEWDECIETLERKLGRDGGEFMDWLVIAMAYQQLGDPQEARDWYERAQEWIATHRARYEREQDYVLFRNEAAALLGIEEQDDE